MKTLVAVLLVAIAGVLGTSEENKSIFPDPSWARPVLKSQVNVNLKDDDTCNTLYSCAGCKAAKVCKPTNENGIFAVVSTIPCPADRPYCDPNSGTCVSEAPGNCGDVDTNFICMGNGKYPDKDCTKFHVCADLTPTLFQCSVAGQKYNPEKQICETSDTCAIFDCSTVNQAKKAAHSEHGRYFAYCNEESNGVLVVDSCPPHYKLDSQTQNCVPDCSVEGIIPDAKDCHFYHKCSQVTLRKGMSYMISKRMMCPDKQAYSPPDFLCVDEDRVESCKSKA